MSGKTLQETHLPLTTAQRGVWMGTLLRTQGGTFNIAEAVEILGPVDPALFRAALVQVAQEAETTRVSIRMGADGPYQVILPTLRCPLPFVDFSTRPDAAVQAQHWMMERISQPVDLAEDPLWTCALIKLSADSFIWFHCCHHIALDGFSGGLIVARVAELYNAMVEGRNQHPARSCLLNGLLRRKPLTAPAPGARKIRLTGNTSLPPRPRQSHWPLLCRPVCRKHLCSGWGLWNAMCLCRPPWWARCRVWHSRLALRCRKCSRPC